jgi:chorismate dehydratase
LAAAGEISAGLLPVADFLRLKSQFDRLGPFGIAVRGRVRSVLLFARKPIRQLEGAVIAITEDTSTSAVLLRLLLEQRYHVIPAGYEPRRHAERRKQLALAAKERRQDTEADALLLIGDEALQFQKTNTQYPYEFDLGFEWWLWQHLPCTFAVWAVRKDVPVAEKRQLELSLSGALGRNMGQLEAIAHEHAPALGLSPQEAHSYLSSFVYRLSQPEEEGIARFEQLANAHHLL